MKDWTIMVYMAGDNNLSEDMVTGLIGMKKNLEATFDANVAFLAYYDTGALSFPTVRCDFTKNGAEDKEKGAPRSHASPFIEPNRNEETSADSIYEFVKWCVEERGHAAENYALIFSGHGDGFQPSTFLSDENPVSSLTIPGLRKVLKKIKNEVLGNKKLGVLGFDSCVMGTLEVAYELSDVADLMVASQGLVPNNGWDYAVIAEEISATSGRGERLDKEKLAGIFTRAFIRTYWDYAFYSARSVDVSVCDLNEVETLGKAVFKLGRRLASALKGNPSVVRKIEQALLTSHHRAQTHVFEQCVDAADFCANLRRECAALRQEAEGMLEAVKPSPDTDGIRRYLKELSETAAGIAAGCGGVLKKTARCVRQSLYLGAEFQYSNGLSLYFPWSYISYQISKRLYMKRRFALGGKKKDRISGRPGGWTEFLDIYLSKTMRPARGNSRREFFLFDLPEKSLGKKEKEIFALHSPANGKFNSSYNAKFNSSYDDKFNSSYNDKLNSSHNSKFNSSYDDKFNSSYDDKFNSSYDDKFNSSYDDKFNSSYDDKFNSSYNDKLLRSVLGNFGRTKNSPWAPTMWQPAEALFEDEAAKESNRESKKEMKNDRQGESPKRA